MVIVSLALQPALLAAVIIEKPQSDHHVNYAVKLSHIAVVTSQLGEYWFVWFFFASNIFWVTALNISLDSDG